jgi:hypothetical protein
MQMIIYNIAKQRLETIDIKITKENTTWFEDIVDTDSVLSITDFQDGLLIKQCDYSSPIWFYDISRADIGHNHQRAKKLLLTI